MRQKFKFIVPFILLLEIFLCQTAYAQNSGTPTPVPTYSGGAASISQYLCTPTSNTASATTNVASNDLYNCINKLYKLAIVVASIASVFIIIIAGYMYMSADGNSEAVGTAKNMITSAIIGMILLFAGYMLLNYLNPDLVQFRSIQPANVVSTTATGLVSPVSTSATSCNQSFGLSASSGCTVGLNCVDVSSYTPTHDCSSNGGTCLLSQQAASRAQTFINTFNQLGGASGCQLKISAAIEGSSGPSSSSCHQNGTCVDFNLLPYNTTCQQDFYQAAQTSGSVVSFQDEYQSACVANTTTGGNIHVNF